MKVTEQHDGGLELDEDTPGAAPGHSQLCRSKTVLLRYLRVRCNTTIRVTFIQHRKTDTAYRDIVLHSVLHIGAIVPLPEEQTRVVKGAGVWVQAQARQTRYHPVVKSGKGGVGGAGMHAGLTRAAPRLPHFEPVTGARGNRG